MRWAAYIQRACDNCGKEYNADTRNFAGTGAVVVIVVPPH